MTWLQILGYLFALLIILTLFLVGFEKRIVYHPYKYPKGNWDIASFRLRVEDVFFFSADGLKLHGWYIPHKKTVATLLWFHGNAGNITHRLDNILKLQALGINILIFDYRGYGRSEGEPFEEGIYRDSMAAYDFLIREKKILPETIFLFGRSLGGICAAKVASRKKSAGLILESTFTSAKDMAKALYPVLPLRYLIRSKFDAQESLTKVTVPKLFLHGKHDEIVPYQLGQKLFNIAPRPKKFYTIPKAGHNDTYLVAGSAYFKEFSQFISKSLSSREMARKSQKT